MKKFKVGDYVEGNGWTPQYTEQYKKGWKRGYIHEIRDSVAVLVNGKGDYVSSVYVVSLRDPAGSLAKGKPVKQRNGMKAVILSFEGKGGRPILAEIQTKSGPRRLSYSKWGHFYKNVELSIDLVPA